MKTGRIVLFLMVLSMLWCADVFAHTLVPMHIFVPGTRAILARGQSCDLEPVSAMMNGHGHIDKFHDENDLTAHGQRTPTER